MKFKEVVDHLKNHGESKNQPDSKYNPKQLKMGTEVEYEHTPSTEAAKEIAKDHLEEFPDYYNRLKKMEDEAEKELKELGLKKYVEKYLGKNK